MYPPEQKDLNWKWWELGTVELAAHFLAIGYVRAQFDTLYSSWQMWGGFFREGKSLPGRGQHQIKSKQQSNKVKDWRKQAFLCPRHLPDHWWELSSCVMLSALPLMYSELSWRGDSTEFVKMFYFPFSSVGDEIQYESPFLSQPFFSFFVWLDMWQI